MRMGPELAKLLESHPLLPFQGAGGLLSLTQQAFQDTGLIRKISERVLPRTRAPRAVKAKAPTRDLRAKAPKDPRTTNLALHAASPVEKAPGKNGTTTIEPIGGIRTQMTVMIGAGARNGVPEATRAGAQTRPPTRPKTKATKAPTRIRAKAKTPVRKAPSRNPPSFIKCRFA